MATAFVDRNEKPVSLPSGTNSTKSTSGGNVVSNQTVSGGTSSTTWKSTQNMTPEALQALQSLVTSLSDHPAINEAAAVAALSEKGLVMPTHVSSMPPPNTNGPFGTSIGTSSPVLTMTNEYGRPVYSEVDYKAALARYEAAKSSVITAGGIIKGGTAESRAAEEQKEKLIQTLLAEHTKNAAATGDANAINIIQNTAAFEAFQTNVQQALKDHAINTGIITDTNEINKIQNSIEFQAYQTNVKNAQEAFSTNKQIVTDANATNKNQNAVAFEAYVKNLAAATEDHTRNVSQNVKDRAVVQQNLEVTQAQQQQQIDLNNAGRAEYSKNAAFNDASTLTANYARKLAEQIMPTILRSGEASGTSGSAVQGLLAQDAVARTAEAAAANAATMAVNYGGVATQLAGVNANLIAAAPKLQEIAPVTGTQQINPVAPVNPALIQPVQQITPTTPLNQAIIQPMQQINQVQPVTAQLTNDNLMQTLSQLTTTNSTKVLDGLLAALGLSKGAVENTTQSQTGTNNQNTQTVQQTAQTENKAVVQTGTNAAPTQITPATQTRQLPALDTSSPFLKITKSATVDDNAGMWDNYTFGGS